jgi:hypothetical protein
MNTHRAMPPSLGMAPRMAPLILSCDDVRRRVQRRQRTLSISSAGRSGAGSVPPRVLTGQEYCHLVDQQLSHLYPSYVLPLPIDGTSKI